VCFLAAAFESIGTMLASAETPVFAAEEAKKALIGLSRDLRGLAFAFNTKTSYMMLFDWMYPFKNSHNIYFTVRLV
jgi:exportin-7